MKRIKLPRSDLLFKTFFFSLIISFLLFLYSGSNSKASSLVLEESFTVTTKTLSRHYIARGRTILRWDLDNVYPQCSHCNVVHNSNPAPFTLAILKKYGTKRITHLNKVAKEAVGKKISLSTKRELLKELTLDKQSV